MKVNARAISGSFEARKTSRQCSVLVASRIFWSFDSGISPQYGDSETKWGTSSMTGQRLPHDAQRHSSSEQVRPPAHHGHAHSRHAALPVILPNPSCGRLLAYAVFSLSESLELVQLSHAEDAAPVRSAPFSCCSAN